MYARELETTMEPGYWARRATQAAEQPATPEQPASTPAQEPQQGGEEPQPQTITHSETITEQQASGMFAYGFGLGVLQLFGWYNGALSGHTSAQLRESWPETVTTGESINTWQEEIPFDMQIPEVAYEPEVIAALEQQGYAEQDIRYLWVSGITNEEAHTYLVDTIHGDIVSGTDIVYDISYISNVPFAHTQVLYTQGLKGVYKDAYVYGNARVTANTLFEDATTYLYDGQGSVAQTYADGEVTQSLTYDAYGNVQQGDTGLEPYFGYNAEQYIPEAGVQYLRARHYMPGIQSFASQDTYLGEMDEPATHNLYSYGQNNPVNFADPSGHAIAGKTKNTKITPSATTSSGGTSSKSSKDETVKQAVQNASNAVSNTSNNTSSTASAVAKKAKETPVYGDGMSLAEAAKSSKNVTMPTKADALKAAASAKSREFCGLPEKSNVKQLPAQNVVNGATINLTASINTGVLPMPETYTGNPYMDFLIWIGILFGLGWVLVELDKLYLAFLEWWENYPRLTITGEMASELIQQALDENKKHHILKAGHEWGRILSSGKNPDPNDPDPEDWKAIIKAITETLILGSSAFDGYTKQGGEKFKILYNYAGEVIQVNVTRLVNGIFPIW